MTDPVNPRRAGIYGRESKDKRKSVDDQIGLAAEVVDENGWEHTGTYDDGSSASRFARRERGNWERLVADLEAGKLDVLVVWEVTRANREPVSWLAVLNTCRDNHVLIHVISDERTYDPSKSRDWKDLASAGIDAAYETDRLSERVRRGTGKAARSGLPHGPIAYGWQRRYDPETRAFVEQVQHPEQAPIVREIFERVARQDPIIHIVRDLRERGVLTQKGRQWSPILVKQVVRNMTHVGLRGHNGDTHRAVWHSHAIVDQRTFDRANAVLDQPDRARRKPGKRKWLMTYVAAGKCGNPLQVNTQGGRRRPFYRCSFCGCVSVGVDEMDEYMSRVVVERLSRDDAKDLFLADGTEAAKAQDEAEALRRRLAEWQQAARRGEVTPGSFAEIESGLVADIDAAEKRRVAASAHPAVAELVTADDVRGAWDDMPLAAKRDVFDTLFASVVVGSPVRRLTRWSDEDDKLAAVHERVEITWRAP